MREEARQAVVHGDLQSAQRLFQEAIRLGSKDADVYNNLATIYDQLGGRVEEEMELLVRACELAPDDADIRKNLVHLLRRERDARTRAGELSEAMPYARLIVQLAPESAADHRELGHCSAGCGDLEEALMHFTQAINLAPDTASYYTDLGVVFFEMRLLSEALGAFQEVLRLDPGSPVAYSHLGVLAHVAGLNAVAVSMLERAVAVGPNCFAAHSNLAVFLRDQGDIVRARSHFCEALRIQPQKALTMSSYLLSLNDDPKADPDWVAVEHRRFQTLIDGPRRRVCPRDREGNRKLRIGYLSPDFRTHSVAYFVIPILENRDREEADVTCYSLAFHEDASTERVKTNCDAFKKVYRMSDSALAKLIAEDGIDILVELSGHTAENRLAMLANRVAPIQVTYLGYPNTTGLAEMDYRITDDIADPVGMTERWHTETLLRLPGGFLAYRPSFKPDELPVEPLPFEKKGHITFGSFNNMAKVNDLVLDTWAAILAEVPDGELLLKAKGCEGEKVQTRIGAALAGRGIDSKRIRLFGHEHSADRHLALYNQIDIALDTFPYNGTTTTCEALWMGTPVVTFEGRSHAGRVGASLLQRTGLSALVARDREGYIQIAVALAQNRARLAEVRTGLRERFEQAPTMDAGRVARELETACRQIWQDYCARPAT